MALNTAALLQEGDGAKIRCDLGDGVTTVPATFIAADAWGVWYEFLTDEVRALGEDFLTQRMVPWGRIFSITPEVPR